MQKPEDIKKNIGNKLSVLILTNNEEDNIDSLIANTSFADEIVFIDSFSTDGTVDRIKRHGSVLIKQNNFENFSAQRNYALKQCSHDWVLFLDADERVTENLTKEIIEVLRRPGNVRVFGFYRNVFFKKELLKFGGFQTDKVYRLFNRKYVKYDETKFVHETLEKKVKRKLLKGKLDHFSYNSTSKYKEKLTMYAKLRAKELYIRNLKPKGYHFYVKPIFRFFKHFIIRIGILDGKKGLIMAKLSAFGVRQRYIELEKLIAENKS